MNNQFVIFELENQHYAIDIKFVNEITEIKEITKVPNAESFIEGVLNLRGSIIPIINLKSKLKLVSSITSKQILVIENHQKKVGLIIDAAKDVKTVSENMIEIVKDLDRKQNHEFKVINDQDRRLIIILDTHELINLFINETDIVTLELPVTQNQLSDVAIHTV